MLLFTRTRNVVRYTLRQVMGLQQSSGQVAMDQDTGRVACTFPDGLEMERGKYACDSMNHFSVLRPDDPDKARVQQMIRDGTLPKDVSRALGCGIGLPVGDALGAPLEFAPVRYGSEELKEMGQRDVWERPDYNKFRLKSGQWTDDASMSLCVADSLLVNNGFDPLDLRLRFVNWWQFGYNNAFAHDEQRMGSSVGLGGNIGSSFSEFMQKRTEYTTAGDRRTSGNGSLMRLAPVPLWFAKDGDVEEAMSTAYKHSKTTHQGDEAAECCRLLTYIVIKAIRYEGESPVPKSILENLGEEFTSSCYSVQCLAESRNEEEHAENKELRLEDRQWNWKSDGHRYCASRARQQPGYVGSYAMDNLAMSLHCVWSTDSFEAAVLKAANMRGDSDTVCAVVAQIAGAMYGVEAIPASWLEAVQRWDKGGDIALRMYKLYTHTPL
eukprot:TRINITY_DN1595_c0_g3_i1.p1 TRINITY_DN1595_c0_g3~~TRINITY_DN1595_c0_g3_i1.p1  ORF type:complete len:438 (-),score=181.53 TRINITY_DN1595_c0_g3_i1:337-1650(-)